MKLSLLPALLLGVALFGSENPPADSAMAPPEAMSPAQTEELPPPPAPEPGALPAEPAMDGSQASEQPQQPAEPPPAAVETPADSTAAPAAPSKRRASKDKTTAEQEVDVITTYKGDVNQLKSPKKAFFLSFLLPGLGEYYAKAHPARIAAPLLVEAASYTVAAILYGKYKDRTNVFKKFADAHYSHADFMNWYRIIDTTPKTVIHLEQGFSHDSLYMIEQLTKSNDYYEMIGKYPTFVQGWDDRTPDMTYDYMVNNPTRDVKLGPQKYWPEFRGMAIDYVRYTPGDSIVTDTVFMYYQDNDPKRPYFFGRSQHQLDYMDLRDEANTMGDYFRLTFVALLVNRIASSIDAVLAANAFNRKMTGGSLSAIERMRLVPTKLGYSPVPINGLAVQYGF